MPAIETTFEFLSQGYSDADLNVVRLSGEERLGRPFEFILDLAGGAVDPERILANPAVLTLRSKEREQRYHGHVCWFVEAGVANGLHRYRLKLAPPVARLEHFRTNAVYVDKTVPDIIKDVLSHVGLHDGQGLRFKLQDQYPERELTCRCRETELNFLHRLMERHGLYYFFDPSSEHPLGCMIVADSPAAHTPAGRRATLRFRNAYDATSRREKSHVASFELDMRQAVSATAVGDYNPERPDVAIDAKHACGKSPGVERYYGGVAQSREEADKLAAVLAQGRACEEKVFTGKLLEPLVRSGECVKLQDHPLEAFNADYLVTAVLHEGSQPHRRSHGGGKTVYHAAFTAIPADKPFRLLWVTPRPVVSGILSARIDAEGSGKYAEVDEQGRYRIILPFGNQVGQTPAAAKIRMLQPYGGGDHGLHLPLHKHTEALIAFLQGDPDRPVICGAAPNVSQPSQVTVKSQTSHTLVTSSGNAFTMDDAKGVNRLHVSSPYASTRIVLGSMPEAERKEAHERAVNIMNSETSGSGGQANNAGDLSDITVDDSNVQADLNVADEKKEKVKQKGENWFKKHFNAGDDSFGLHMITDGLFGVNVGVKNTVILGDSESLILGSKLSDFFLSCFTLSLGPTFKVTLGDKYKAVPELTVIRADDTRLGWKLGFYNGEVKKAAGEHAKAVDKIQSVVGEINDATASQKDLKDKVKRLENEYNALKGEIVQIRDKTESIQNEVNIMEGEINAAKNKKTEIINEVNELSAAKQGMKDDLQQIAEERNDAILDLTIAYTSKDKISGESASVVTFREDA
ncbi:MAG: type secretion system secreted protein VgrG [Desulfovibrionales bacterium]|nr:type secretion system secreted protein VgrG [Desulfovibrionales bacterium]